MNPTFVMLIIDFKFCPDGLGARVPESTNLFDPNRRVGWSVYENSRCWAAAERHAVRGSITVTVLWPFDLHATAQDPTEPNASGLGVRLYVLGVERKGSTKPKGAAVAPSLLSPLRLPVPPSRLGEINNCGRVTYC
jgi:hypothetical protein